MQIILFFFFSVHLHHQGPRAQIDRKLYKRHMQDALHSQPNLTLRGASVADLVITPEDGAGGGRVGTYGRVRGVKLGE